MSTQQPETSKCFSFKYFIDHVIIGFVISMLTLFGCAFTTYHGTESAAWVITTAVATAAIISAISGYLINRAVRFTLGASISGVIGSLFTCFMIVLAIGMNVSQFRSSTKEVSSIPDSIFLKYADSNGVLSYQRIQSVLTEQGQIAEQEYLIANVQKQLTQVPQGKLADSGPDIAKIIENLKLLQARVHASEIPAKDTEALYLLSKHMYPLGHQIDKAPGRATVDHYGCTLDEIHNYSQRVYTRYHRWYWAAAISDYIIGLLGGQPN